MHANPPLQGVLLLATQLDFVSGTTVSGTLYGIAFVLYCLYLHAVLSQLWNHDRRRQAQFMITYSTIIMISASFFLITNAWVTQDAYIKHSDFPGGPMLYEESTFHTQPVVAVAVLSQLAIDILTAAIQIWRLWVVWSGSRYARLVVIVPVLSLLSLAALGITTIVHDVRAPNAGLIGGQYLKIAGAGFAMRGTATIFPTISIAGFLIFQGWRQRKLTGKPQLSSQYMNVVAILIESYALESIWIIIFTILFSINHPVGLFFNDNLAFIEVIAYLLVMYRVAKGRTYGSQRAHGSSNQGNNIGSLRWNHTTTQSGVTNVTDTNTPHSSGILPEPNAVEELSSPV